MKPLNKKERWYAFLEIIFRGHMTFGLPFHHTDYGMLSECTPSNSRADEIDKHVYGIWKNPPQVSYE